METVTGWLESLQQWMTHASYCAGEPLQIPVCRPFWTWTVVAVFTVGALLLIAVLWKIVSYKVKLAAALKAERQRAHVDPTPSLPGAGTATRPTAPSSAVTKSSGAYGRRSSSGAPRARPFLI